MCLYWNNAIGWRGPRGGAGHVSRSLVLPTSRASINLNATRNTSSSGLAARPLRLGLAKLSACGDTFVESRSTLGRDSGRVEDGGWSDDWRGGRRQHGAARRGLQQLQQLQLQ